ncbi:MAG TPA: tetratricopeptide repeat protein [Opitutaceae bacterium]|jgi:tetratricopeptide (TPR) repeat protein|nr:tetratricopeptide repeat protein [Opitutaceae bacterium]
MSPARPSRLPEWAWPALILAASLASYAPAWRGAFVWDDDGHVTKPELRSLHGLARIWTEPAATQQYYPILHTAFWIEHRLWGDAPLGYHLLNILLHAAAAWLFVLVLRRLAVPGALLAGFIFALHPVAVESVAWVSEQKNTLSAVFYLAAALIYLRGEGSRRAGSYAAATALFVLAVLSKTVAATLPAALLVIAWWQRGRISLREIRWLGPWLALGAAGGAVTAWVEHHLIGAAGSAFDLTWPQRFVLSGRVVWFYLGKLLWPADLMFMYPRWTIDAGDPAAWLPLAGLLLAALALALLARTGRSWARAALAAGLIYVGTLFPALGFVDVYPFRYSFVADHFQYLASLGVIALAAAGAVALARKLAPTGRSALAVALLAALAALSFRQARAYAGPDELYRATLARNPGSWLAHNNLAARLLVAGRADIAAGRIREAAGELDEAVAHYRDALRYDRADPEAHDNLGLALAAEGRSDEAIAEFEAALRMNPRLGQAHYNLGLALVESRRVDEGIGQYREALRLSPDRAEVHNNLGAALAIAGRLPEAAAEFARALQLQPDYPDAQRNLALANRILGR